MSTFYTKMIISYVFINVCMCVSVNICHVRGCFPRPEEGIGSSAAGCGHLGMSAGCSFMELSL